MTRVLLVYHDVDVADVEGDWLRRAGYEVDRCGGPAGAECPVLNGMRCWQVDKADVLLYDVWEHGRGAPDLVAELRAVHPDKPLVLTSSGRSLNLPEVEWRDGEPPIFHAPTRASLVPAIEEAMRTPVSPVPPASAAGQTAGAVHAPVGPQW